MLRIEEIERRLRHEYGQPRHHNPHDPLEDLIFILLSRMTQEVKYVRTYEALRATYASWDLVRDAPRNELVMLLRDSGLAETKARHIRGILKELGCREGALTLNRLKNLDDEQVLLYLTSLPGVGIKTAKCVMLYAFERDVLPVDAHVWRIARRLGIATGETPTGRAVSELENRVPSGFRGSLHVTMVAHGRMVCTAQRPRCSQCVLSDLCPSRRADEG